MGREIFFTHIISSCGIFSIKVPVRVIMPSRIASNHLNQVTVAMMIVIKRCKTYRAAPDIYGVQTYNILKCLPIHFSMLF